MGDVMSAETHNAVDRIISEARRAGKDPVEQLHRHGLILDERRLMQLRIEAMDQVIEMINATPAHQLLRIAGQPSNLAEDYRKALIEVLADLSTRARGRWFA
jgi:CHASE3 domain sensor protein